MTFSVGDLITLKSGGPLMTISEVGSNAKCVCIWFVNAESEKFNSGVFPNAALESASE